MGGHLTLSDDSHSTSQVGTHYAQALAGIEKLGVKTLTCLAEVSGNIKPLDDERFPHVGWTYVSVEEIREKGTWKAE
jgi:imidazoleglycerol phosphate synthase glutamine amidotransferase subunit HisH